MSGNYEGKEIKISRKCYPVAYGLDLVCGSYWMGSAVAQGRGQAARQAAVAYFRAEPC